jgi:hypothetical protein
MDPRMLQSSLSQVNISQRKEMSCGRLNASWKISSSAVDGQSFLVIDGSLLNKNKRKDWFLRT